MLLGAMPVRFPWFECMHSLELRSFFSALVSGRKLCVFKCARACVSVCVSVLDLYGFFLVTEAHQNVLYTIILFSILGNIFIHGWKMTHSRSEPKRAILFRFHFRECVCESDFCEKCWFFDF